MSDEAQRLQELYKRIGLNPNPRLHEVLEAGLSEAFNKSKNDAFITVPFLVLGMLFVGRHRPQNREFVTQFYNAFGSDETDNMVKRVNQLHAISSHSYLSKEIPWASSEFLDTLVASGSPVSDEASNTSPEDVIITLLEKRPIDCQILFPQHIDTWETLLTATRKAVAGITVKESTERRLRKIEERSSSRSTTAEANHPQSTRPSSKSYKEWRRYLESRYGKPFTDGAIRILIAAVEAADKQRSTKDGLIPINTKHLLIPFVQDPGPLRTLHLGSHAGAYSGIPPWHEPLSHEYESDEDRMVYGKTRPSVEFAAILQTAAGLVNTTIGFPEVTEWHLAFAAISSQANGLNWQLRAQDSSLAATAIVLRRNLASQQPKLEPLFNWSDLEDDYEPFAEEAIEETDSDDESRSWSRAFHRLRNPREFKWSTSCGQILDKLWHSHGIAASFARQSDRRARNFNPRLSPRGLFVQCLIYGFQESPSLTEQNLLARIAGVLDKSEEELRDTLQSELHRGPETTSESNPVATQRLLDVISQAKAIRDDVGNDDYVSTRHLVAALLLPSEGTLTGAMVLDNNETALAEKLVDELTKFIQRPAATSIEELPLNWDKWISQLRRGLPGAMEESSPSTSEQEDPESDDRQPVDSAAKRGPRSLLPHHPPNASQFRRLIESERNLFDEFVRESSLQLSYASWNANAIAWEDTAALGDSDRDPVVTCRSVFIGFLETGLAERQQAEEGSLPAAFARASQMNSEQLTKFRIALFHATKQKNENSILRADPALLALWQHAARISHQCTEDKIVAARHLVAAFLFLHKNDPQVGRQLDSVEFNPKLSLALLQEHLSHYETANHPGWRSFFHRLGVAVSSNSIEFGTGITPSRYNSLCLGIEKTSAAIAEIFKSARNPQSLPDPKGEKSGRVSDFVFALYGPWGRGKSTLMSSVAAILTQDPDAAKPATTANPKRTFEWLKSPWAWLSGVLFGYPNVTKNYATLEFSAWKYPSRPEVWVHLYERVRELAESNSLLQRLRLSFRLGLLESGWWPLLFGFILLAVPRLPIADWAGGIWKASGWLGCLLIAGFFLRVFRIGSLVGQRYMKIPSHADKLGLQAVIGRDLKNLLQVWISPPNAKIIDEKLSATDFRWFRQGCWMSLVIVALIVFSVWKACDSIQAEHRIRLEKSAALHQKLDQPPGTTSIQAKVHYPLGELNFSIPASSQIIQREVPGVMPQDPFWIYVVLIATGALAIIAGWIITRPPKQHETLLLTVDDLDRCDSDQMLAVIDSLRLFLDDQEMSQRLQMAMLLDRGLLQESLRARIKQAGIEGTDDQDIRNFHRTHREKVFLCEFSMPPLQEHERNELLKSLFPNAEPPQQRPATSTTAAPTATKTPESPRTKDQSTSVGRTLSAAPAAQPKPETPENSKSPNVPGKPEAAPETSNQEGAAASSKSEASLSQSDTSALVHAISRIPSTQLTPRSMLMLKVRFELVRLLLKHQLENYEPDDATLSGIATSLVEDLFPSLSLYSAPLPKEVKAVVNQVTGNEHRP